MKFEAWTIHLILLSVAFLVNAKPQEDVRLHREKRFLSVVANGFRDLGEKMKDTVNDLASGILVATGATEDFFRIVGKEVKAGLLDVAEGAKDAADDVGDAGKEFGQGVATTSRKVFRFIQENVEDLYLEVKEEFESIEDIDFNIAVAKLSHFIDSGLSQAACVKVCGSAAKFILRVPVVTDVACRLLCKGTLLLLEDLAIAEFEEGGGEELYTRQLYNCTEILENSTPPPLP